MTRFRLLFVSPVFPHPPDRGINVRIRQMIEACTRDFEVTLVAPSPLAINTVPDLPAGCTGHLLSRDATITRAASLKARLTWSARSAELVGAERAALLSAFERHLAELNVSSFDVVWVERGFLAALPPSGHPKKVVDLDDIEHVKFFREAAHAENWSAKTRLILTAAMLWWREAVILPRRCPVAVCSNDDAARLRRFGHRRILVAPNGTDIPASPRFQRESSGGLRCVFLGNMQHRPNLDAVDFFAKEIRPYLNEHAWDVTLDVVGGGVDPADPPLARDWLRWHGFVKDLDEAFASADIFVAPLRYGSGTKLKILDAMARGIPVVTTPIGAEGLDIRHNEHAMIARHPASFAQAVAEIWCKPALGEHLARNACNHVRARFDWPTVRTHVADWLGEWVRKDLVKNIDHMTTKGPGSNVNA